MILQFFVLIFILLSLNQSEILFRSAWKDDISSGELIILYHLLSSAYKAIELSLLITPGKSYI